MGTIGTFLLAVAAFVGTVMLLTNPGSKLEKWMRGKKTSQLEADVKAWFERTNASEVIGKGCGFAFFLLLSLVYTFIVEPLAIIAALVNKVGYQPVAYAMLVIVALSWVKLAQTLMPKNKKTAPKGVVVTKEGKKVEGVVVNVDEEVKLPHPWWMAVNRVFYSLPTIYLWYMFFVVIGVLK